MHFALHVLWNWLFLVNICFLIDMFARFVCLCAFLGLGYCVNVQKYIEKFVGDFGFFLETIC